MALFERKTALEAAWLKIEKDEKHLLEKRAEKKQSAIGEKLEEKVPQQVIKALEAVFTKAFYFVFEKGTGVIEKTYNKEKLEKEYQVRHYATQVKKDKSSLRAIMLEAKKSGAGNLLLTGSLGLGMGTVGIGLPDVPVLTSMMLKSIYEIALSYGYAYENEQERLFILLLIQGAFSYGKSLEAINQQINTYITSGSFKIEKKIEKEIEKTARLLSKELLGMKFLQGIPIVGAIGGVYDAVYMRKLTSFSELKYRRRYLYDERLRKKKGKNM